MVIYSNTYSHSKEETNSIIRCRAFGVGSRIQEWIRPQISCAMPGNPSQERETFQCGSGTEAGCCRAVCFQLDQEICNPRNIRSENEAGPRPQTDNGLYRRNIGSGSRIAREAKCESSQEFMGGIIGKEGKRDNIQTFFRSSGARYKRIPKRPRMNPSPHLYAIKREKLQVLEKLSNQGLIDLFFGDESHVCTQGYVPYGWQFPGENVYVPSMKSARLNIFGMINRDNVYHGFTSSQGIKAENVADFIDDFSTTITRPTFIVLDNASVHTGGKMKESIEKWKDRGLYIFYLPIYSPHLNIAETLWRILKTKWLKPSHYVDTHTLFDTTHRILDGIGTMYTVNYSKVA